ncbi:unnamed protein product, partial [Durusdinium trenchii]
TAFSEYFHCPALEVQSESLFPVEEIHLEDAFFSDFAFTNALLNAEKQSRQANEDGSSARYWPLEEPVTPVTPVTRRGSERETTQSGRLTTRGRRGRGSTAWKYCLEYWKERLAEGSRASAIWAVPLHSTLPKERQQQVFRRPPRGKVKVILGTNIAESSVTIGTWGRSWMVFLFFVAGDVEVVIDSGLKLGSKQRELTYDPKRRISSLDTVWVSQSGAVQRRGRAGRVRAGRVLRLYSREQFDALPLQPSPEMQRCDLAQSCLQTVALGRHPRSFLANAIDPPDVAAVEMAMEQLVAIHAVDHSDPDPEVCPLLLPIGEVLARLPLEPLLGGTDRSVMTSTGRSMSIMTSWFHKPVPGPSLVLGAPSFVRQPSRGGSLVLVSRGCPKCDTV